MQILHYTIGNTNLPHIGLSVIAKKVSAVYFGNINHYGQPDENTLNTGMQVLAGKKWIAAK